jgi:hypothetical protein
VRGLWAPPATVAGRGDQPSSTQRKHASHGTTLSSLVPPSHRRLEPSGPPPPSRGPSLSGWPCRRAGGLHRSRVTQSADSLRHERPYAKLRWPWFWSVSVPARRSYLPRSAVIWRTARALGPAHLRPLPKRLLNASRSSESHPCARGRRLVVCHTPRVRRQPL